MRKLVLILIAFIAVVTFITAYDNSGVSHPENQQAEVKIGISASINDASIDDTVK